MYHYRKSRKKYDSFPKPTDCSFCDRSNFDSRSALEYAHCWVVPNRTFYDIWELRSVSDHLLVIPKRHVESLGELKSDERLDLIDVIAEHEARGYNVYARAPGNSQRSVAHQHTHLLKVDDKPARGSLVLRRPYFMIKF